MPAYGRKYLFESVPRMIGKKEWRIVVYEANGYLGAKAFTDYEWREPAWHGLPPGDWNRSEEWPRYNSDDGMYAGLPRTLRKFYDEHRQEVASCTPNP